MTDNDLAASGSRVAAHRCDLTRLSGAEKSRRALLLEWLQVGTSEVVERSDGYAFWVDPRCRIAQHLEEFIVIQQRCCPFLRLHVQTHPEHDGPVLEIGGTEGVKEFLAAQFGIRGHAG